MKLRFSWVDCGILLVLSALPVFSCKEDAFRNPNTGAGSGGDESSFAGSPSDSGGSSEGPSASANGGSESGNAAGGEDMSTAGTSSAGTTAAGGAPVEACSKQIAPQIGGSAEPLDYFVAYFCDLQRLCCREGCFGTRGFDTCEARYDDANATLRNLVELGTVLVDHEAFDECTRTLRTRVTSCWQTLSTMSNNLTDTGIPACVEAVQGTIAEGDPCHDDSECIHTTDPAICRMDSESATVGVCHVVRKGQVGDVCFRTEGFLADPSHGGSQWNSDIYNISPGSTRCMLEDGLYCADGGHCATLRAAGAACSHLDCASGLYCSAEKKCTPLTATGASCNTNSRCAEGGCVAGKCTTLVLGQALCEGSQAE